MDLAADLAGYVQRGILEPETNAGRYVYFSVKPEASVAAVTKALEALSEKVAASEVVVGLGASLLAHCHAEVEGMRVFPAGLAGDVAIPSTPEDLWCWLRGDDLGELVHLSRWVVQCLSMAFELSYAVGSFQYRDSRDLTGYEDGTENPEGDEALQAAVSQSSQTGVAGSSFVAVQQWRHDLDRFEAFPAERRDHTIGRRISDNEEIEDAPGSAHVKRTAQEDFEPEAFVLRRSMPWGDGDGEGLVFVAFGNSFDAYEALLRRMSGEEDGIRDALFDFTRPQTGGYFWCPPMLASQVNGEAGQALDLRRLQCGN
ncbi:MAG: Dyp-type peroxidase [bacterium]